MQLLELYMIRSLNFILFFFGLYSEISKQSKIWQEVILVDFDSFFMNQFCQNLYLPKISSIRVV